jgi:ABC-type multidrug transport system fused ATPase/permease subunit
MSNEEEQSNTDFENDNKIVKPYIEHIDESDSLYFLIKKLFIDYFIKNKIYTISFIIFAVSIWVIKIFLFDNTVSELTMHITKGQSLTIITKIVIILISVKFFLEFLAFSVDNLVSNIIPDYNSYIRNIAVHKLYYKFYDNLNITISYSTFLQILFDLCYHLRHIMLYFLSDFIIIIFALIIKLFFMYSIHKTLFYVTFIALILCCVIIYRHSISIIKNSSQRSNAVNKINKKIHNNFENLINIYINNQTNNEIEKTTQLEKEFNISYKQQLKSVSNFTANINMYFNVLFTILIIISLYLYKSKEIDAKQFISLFIISNTYVIFLSENLNSIPSTFLVPFGTLDNFYNILVFLFSEDIIKENSSKYNYNEKRIINNINNWNITIKDLSFRYNPTSKYIFKNFNFNIDYNDFILIKGRSGIGKSTLAKILLGLFNNYYGNIYIDNKDIQHINLEYLRDNITYVSQNNTLYNISIIDNIKYGNNVSNSVIIKLLKEYGFYSLFDKLENGLDTIYNSSNSKLSYGMMKIVLLIRGVLRKSKIIIFDEPTNGLDPSTKDSFLKLLKSLINTKTIMVITHTEDFKNFKYKEIKL